MKINHFIGGILLVAGTTIGVGLLALPVTTAFMGFFPSLILLVVCWLFMLVTALFFIDVNCSIPGEINLITMASRTTGTWGKIVSWIVYLLLLYSLIAAYIAASSPLFVEAFAYISNGVVMPGWVSHFCLPVIFGSFIYLGTAGVDLINRLLMIGLIVAYLLLVVFLPSHVHVTLLSHVDWSPFVIAFPVVLTAFGYHIIIPSLTNYLNHDKKHLIATIVVGSLIALAINILWQVLVLGSVPLEGANGLYQAWKQGISAAGPLSVVVESPLIGIGAYFFSFFAIITSFLGVALSLADFLCDGLKIKKTWEGRLLAMLLTFIPPIVFVFSYQRGFIIALEYAGAFVAILLVFIPAAMAWTLKKPRFYRSVLGKVFLSSVMLFAVFVVVINILIQSGVFSGMIDGLINKKLV